MIQYRNKDICGNFFENGNKPLLVILGGSEGKMPSIGKPIFEFLKARYNILFLSYFGEEYLPMKLSQIPLEYFINSISYFTDKFKIPQNNVILLGTSKGGELALLLHKYIQASAIIACVPSCYVFQAISFSMLDFILPKSSWSYNGKDIPFVRYKPNISNIIRFLKDKSSYPLYCNSIKLNKNSKTYIDVEDYKGKILLLSVDNDIIWPSKEMCKTILDRSSGNKNIKHVALETEHNKVYMDDHACKEIESFLLDLCET